MAVKYIFVTGGVVSGLGKGIAAASLGRLLKQRGLQVKVQKLDPYLNVDPGTMSPYQHGEVFVTEDGAETDLDLGHYERFVDEDLTGNSSVSSGKIYWSVLNRERRGDYLGATVQIIPHITDEIKRRIYAMADEDVDVVITEIGGTVGDIESQPFLEAIRQVCAEVGRQDVMYIHVSLIVAIPGVGELKSKPTQHSVKELLGLGIQPDVIICRSEYPVSGDIREKIALFCNLPPENVIPNLNASSLYALIPYGAQVDVAVNSKSAEHGRELRIYVEGLLEQKLAGLPATVAPEPQTDNVPQGQSPTPAVTQSASAGLPRGENGLLTWEAVEALAQVQTPGAQITELQLDEDDGKLIYEVKYRDSNWFEYEMDLDAVSGEILKWERE